jgi:hypothetical protein
MKSLVVKQVSTQINDNGTELELGTNQFKANCEYIDKKVVTITSVKVTIDKDTFKTKMGGTLSNSYYYFSREDNQWNLYNGADNVNLAEYGITLDGEVNEDDRLYVYCDTVNNVVTSTGYQQQIVVYKADGKFNYVNIACDVSNATFNIYSVSSGGYESSIYGGVKLKTETLLGNYSNCKIVASTTGYYDTATVSIIVAKVI